jgi:hypothetical protein
MKKSLYLFSAVLVFILMSIFSASAQAQNVLIYDDNSNDQVAQQACANLGYTCTVADSTNFVTLLTGGGWDMVVMDYPSNSPSGDWQTPLAAYINGGGRAIQTGWDAGDFTTLAATYEVVLDTDHNAITLYQWNGHPLFASPNSVPSTLVPADDNWGTNGFYLNTIFSSVAAGGFSLTPSTDNTAIVIGNNNRTIFNGLLFDDYYPADADSDGKDDAVELVENEMIFLLPVQVPTMNEWGMIIFAALAGIGAVYYLRKRYSA